MQTIPLRTDDLLAVQARPVLYYPLLRKIRALGKSSLIDCQFNPSAFSMPTFCTLSKLVAGGEVQQRVLSSRRYQISAKASKPRRAGFCRQSERGKRGRAEAAERPRGDAGAVRERGRERGWEEGLLDTTPPLLRSQ